MAMSCLAGRKDATAADPTNRLPEETLSAEALRLSFEAKGLSAQELVALSGAHTVSCSLSMQYLQSLSFGAHKSVLSAHQNWPRLHFWGPGRVLAWV